MERLNFIILLSVLISFSVSGQAIKKPLEISGKFENSVNKKIYIHAGLLKDSVLTDSQGNFHYKTNKITQPFEGNLGIGKRLNFPFYLAPGFVLKIVANAENEDSFYQSLLLTGPGSMTNQYWVKKYFFEKNLPILPGSNKWFEIKPDSFAYEGLERLNLDAFAIEIEKNVFNYANKEPYEEFFKKYSIIDIKFRKLNSLLQYSLYNGLSTEKTESLIKKCIDPNLFKFLSLDNYLGNLNYKETISFLYLEYLLNKEIEKNKEILQNKVKRKLEIANNLYTGKTKDFVLDHIIKKYMNDTYSLNEMNMFKSFIFKINDQNMRAQLLKEYSNSLDFMANANVGKEAPVFNLPDTSGQMHNLQSFRGKVVFVDLWASWCGPCKREMPLLKILNDEYSSSGKLQIISIAVNDADGKDSRLKFINQHGFNWLQLEDQDGFVSRKYRVGGIPRFILIDKEGKILSYDAPSPSDKEKLKKIIDMAIAK